MTLAMVGKTDDAQFQRVFHIDDAIADVVRRFGQVGQGVAAVADAVFQAQCGEDGVKRVFFGLVEVEFGRAVADGVVGGTGVFDEGPRVG